MVEMVELIPGVLSKIFRSTQILLRLLDGRSYCSFHSQYTARLSTPHVQHEGAVLISTKKTANAVSLVEMGVLKPRPRRWVDVYLQCIGHFCV